jgi:hypothetical protein
MILRMEERGLLSRGRSAEDGRAKSVTLTSGGRSALASAAPRARLADEAIMSALPKNRRAPFLETLQRLAEAADELTEAAPAPAKKARKAMKRPRAKSGAARPRKAARARRARR